jgi:hypothetical protein
MVGKIGGRTAADFQKTKAAENRQKKYFMKNMFFCMEW